MKKIFWGLLFLYGSAVLSAQTLTPGVAITMDGVKSKVPLTPNEFKNLTRFQNPPWAKNAEKDCSIVALKSVEMDGDWEALRVSSLPAPTIGRRQAIQRPSSTASLASSPDADGRLSA